MRRSNPLSRWKGSKSYTSYLHPARLQTSNFSTLSFSDTSLSTSRYRSFSLSTNKRQSQDDSENFWKVPATDLAFWDAYVSTRPNYSASFYGEIYDHHARHSSSWEVAHDVGCGAGQVTAELASRFRHVVASDINDTHLSVSKRRLQSLPADRIAYTHSKGENLAAHHPQGSVDIIAAAEAIVLMDEHAALTSFAQLLKPGGTLVAWFYGRPTFADPTLYATSQPLLDAIMVQSWAKVIRGSRSKRLQGFKRAADGMASWLDYIPFDSGTWTDVRRIKWNPHATLPFFGAEACGFDIDVVSHVQAGERTEERVDPEWWRNDWDLAELKRYFGVLFPDFKQALGKGDTGIDALFNDLGEKMGGEGVMCQFTWPAVLVLATRR